jgi:hypothetical protein
VADSLLQMMQDVCNEVGIPAPSAVVTSTDQQVRQLLALANREGREQASAPGGWPQLRGEQTITMVNGQAAYDFPTDFDSYMPDTIWNRDQRWIVQGPLSAQEWQTLKSGFINVFPYQRYRIMDGQIYFDPTPSSATAGQTVTIEYQSKAWCQSALGVAQTQWLADTDTFKLPADIMVLGVKWRFLAAKRMDYSEEKEAWVKAVDRELARSYGGRTLPMNISNAGQGNFLGDGYSQITDGNWPGRV